MPVDTQTRTLFDSRIETPTLINALGAWAWDYVAKTRSSAFINRPDATHIDWGE